MSGFRNDVTSKDFVCKQLKNTVTMNNYEPNASTNIKGIDNSVIIYSPSFRSKPGRGEGEAGG